jgi:hypothetical protein
MRWDDGNKVLPLLLKHSAASKATDESGQTLVDMARKSGRGEALGSLLTDCDKNMDFESKTHGEPVALNRRSRSAIRGTEEALKLLSR